ncbi:MAG: class I SAM-dependent methyltransferase [Candidatus Nanopelagicaceae bacterium]
MEILNSALISILLLAAIYVIRSQRALHNKMGRQTERLAKAIQNLTQQERENSKQSTRQIEAFIQLNSLLKFSAPLPATRGWVASPDLLLTISQLVKELKPKLVVELGSGVSTLVVAKSGAKKVISFDGDAEFAEQTRELLKEHGVRGVEVRLASLMPFRGGANWYDPSKFKDLKNIDLLIVDGPQGGDNSDARYPALEVLLNKLSSKAIIVLDDVNRTGERKLAEDFAKALPKHQLRILDHEKLTAVIAPK